MRYIIIDKDKQDLKQKYRTQLELEKDPIVFEKSVTFEDTYKLTKPRATKKCEICDIVMLSSSHAKHVKSKAHLKKTLKD